MKYERLKNARTKNFRKTFCAVKFYLTKIFLIHISYKYAPKPLSGSFFKGTVAPV
jgi:hypothetical protein